MAGILTGVKSWLRGKKPAAASQARADPLQAAEPAPVYHSGAEAAKPVEEPLRDRETMRLLVEPSTATEPSAPTEPRVLKEPFVPELSA